MTLQSAAHKLLTRHLGLRKGEIVVVVTDRKDCPIFRAVCKEVVGLGGELKKVRITTKRTNSQPLPHLRETFNQADIIIGVTDRSISHCPETRIARKRYGTRVITMPGIDRKLFLKAMMANQKRVKEIGDKLAEKLRRSGVVRITTPSGTNVTVRSLTSAVSVDDGDSTRKGRLNNLPYGETCMAPINTANGVIAIDFSKISIRPRDKAKVMLRKGKIVEWNSKAKRLVDYLRKADGRKALKVVELGFGTNPAHKKIYGKIVHDEKILGSVHIAFGGFGNARKCKVHEDVVLLKPTVFFDNRLVINKGRIV
jgi:leucyl aminopeptidase (aminopeptidase T)